MSSMQEKTVFITGASRGIGRAIALRLAQEKANVVIAAKTDKPHPKLSGTIHSVAEEVNVAGGNALPLVVDVRDEKQIQAAMQATEKEFGQLDALINNASAIWLASTPDTPAKRFDLMMQVNMRATFLCSQAALPLLGRGENPHILNLSPPLNMKPKWFKDHVAYTMSKYGMSMCTLGMAQEFKDRGIAVNSLWPRTTIATAAIANNFPKEIMEASRKPLIMADAVLAVLQQPAQQTTGHFYIDDDVLTQAGEVDLEKYAVNSKVPLFSDLFLD